MLVEFASAVDAVRCGTEVQRGMAAQNADVPQNARIYFRIGIHVGDIIIDDNDIFGDGVKSLLVSKMSANRAGFTFPMTPIDRFGERRRLNLTTSVNAH